MIIYDIMGKNHEKETAQNEMETKASPPTTATQNSPEALRRLRARAAWHTSWWTPLAGTGARGAGRRA